MDAKKLQDTAVNNMICTSVDDLRINLKNWPEHYLAQNIATLMAARDRAMQLKHKTRSRLLQEYIVKAQRVRGAA